MNSVVYNYYEEAVITLELNKKSNIIEPVTRNTCKLCKKLNRKDKNGEEFKVTVFGKSTSNLISHLQIKIHQTEYDEYLAAIAKNKENSISTPVSCVKRLRLDSPSSPIDKVGFIYGFYISRPE
jgi:hypothetical protein